MKNFTTALLVMLFSSSIFSKGNDTVLPSGEYSLTSSIEECRLDKDFSNKEIKIFKKTKYHIESDQVVINVVVKYDVGMRNPDENANTLWS
jgi:hypothetical protein